MSLCTLWQSQLIKISARARFMIETLTNLKNGKLKTLPGADLDAVNRMKKFLGSLGRKRRRKYCLVEGGPAEFQCWRPSPCVYR